MFRSRKPKVVISIARNALESIFDECDRYDSHETGGRLIGTYHQEGSHYNIDVAGIIGPGPNARRTATSFFQDGNYQEQVFRSIEASHSEIEHLGNWHTHHVNGCPTLSSGDKTTYFNIVNHELHNIDFFYALLVTRKNASGNPRYEVNHYFFRRGDDAVYDIPGSHIRLVDSPTVWPLPTQSAVSSSPNGSSEHLQRVKDQEFFADFYPKFKALFSESLNALYWKGSVDLVDGSPVELAILEHELGQNMSYSITCGYGKPVLAQVSARYQDLQFPSARHALVNLERDLNRAMFLNRENQ